MSDAGMDYRKRDTERLVYVCRETRRNGKPGTMRLWVRGENVKPGDTVLKNAHNVKPAPKKERPPRPVYRRPCGPNVGSKHARRFAAFLREVLRASGK